MARARSTTPIARAIWRNSARAPGADRFAYLGLVAVAKDEEEARERGHLIAGYLRTSPIVHLPFRNPPGYLPAEDNARLMRGETPPRSFTKDGRVINMHTASVEELIDAGILFCGTPDQVYDQIVDFCEHCGGMGNLLMMGHGGELTPRADRRQSHAVRQRGSAAAQGLAAAGRRSGGRGRGGVNASVSDRSGPVVAKLWDTSS